jgi:hypothetical protein
VRGRAGTVRAGLLSGVNPPRRANSRAGRSAPMGRRPVLKVVQPRGLLSGMAQSDPEQKWHAEVSCAEGASPLFD